MSWERRDRKGRRWAAEISQRKQVGDGRGRRLVMGKGEMGEQTGFWIGFQKVEGLVEGEKGQGRKRDCLN